MLNKWKTIKKVYIQIFNNGVKGLSNHLLADKHISLSPDLISLDKGISNHLLADKLIPLSQDLISLDNANKVSMDLPSNPNLTSHNTLIKCSIGKSDKIAASAYNRMRNVDYTSPDRFTLAFLLKSFASFDQLESGKTVHGQVIKLGFVADTFVMNSLLDFYIHFLQGHHGLKVVMKVFEEMPERDIVSWNVIISGLVYQSLYYEALLMFDDMLSSGDHHRCKPDETTLINMLKACSNGHFLEQGQWLDTYIKENKFALSLPLGNALLEIFVTFSDLGKAKMVFKSMSKRCIFTWQTMMTGLVNNGFCKETLMLFDTMCCCSEVEEGVLKPTDDIFCSVLRAFNEDKRLVGDGKRLFRVIHKIVHEFGVKPNKADYDLMISIIAEAGWVEAAMMLAESLTLEPREYAWAYVLYACQTHRYSDDLLLDSWIKKIDDVKKSKQKDHFMKSTIERYIYIIFRQKPNNYAVMMVKSLLRKLSHRRVIIRLDDLEFMDELYNELESTLKENSPDESRKNYSEVHAQQTPHPYLNEDVYKVVESLDRQLLFDLYDQI